MIYTWIGKKVVRYGLRYARRRYSRHAAMALGLLLAGAGAGVAYLAKRDVPEG